MNKNIILENCLNFLKSEEIKNQLKELLKPLLEYFFKEISLYIYFFIFFISSTFIMQLAIIIFILRNNVNSVDNLNNLNNLNNINLE